MEQGFNGRRLGTDDDPMLFQFGALDVLDASLSNDNWMQAVGDLPYRYLQSVPDVS